MSLFELFIIAVGLSMDAFAVSVCKGLSMRKISLQKSLTVGLYFGCFQALMPLLGYFLGKQFASFITDYDHWVTFILLALIGGNMIRESRGGDEVETDASLSVKSMLPLAVATSIDALAVGVSFAFLKVHIAPAVVFIGVITFVLSAIGVKIGNVFGAKYKSRAELAGGIVLVIMGVKILLEHTGILA